MNKNNLNEELHSAIRTGQYELVVKLVNDGADINYKDSSKNDALFYAVVHCKKDIVKYLIQKANLKTLYKDNQNILHIAVKTECEDKGVFEIIELLANQKIDINAQDKYGNTPLSYACVYYVVNRKTIDLLFQHKADMNIVNNYGLSVLTSAKEADRTELLNILDKY